MSSKSILTAIVVLALVAGTAWANTNVWVGWNMPTTPGSVQYLATSDPGPSSTQNIANVVSNLLVTGTGFGYINTRTETSVGAAYYGTYQLVREDLVATGYSSGQALDYTFNANDDVYNRDPSMGFQLDAEAGGNYGVNIQSRHGGSAVETALDLDMSVPGGGGGVAATLQQGTPGNANVASAWLSTSDSGTLTMVKPTSYCSYLGYTVFGDISATGTGDLGLAGSKSSGVFDFKTVGDVDGITDMSTTMYGVSSLFVAANFSISADFSDTWAANLEYGAGKGAYWPSGIGQNYTTGYEFAFDGNLK